MMCEEHFHHFLIFFLPVGQKFSESHGCSFLNFSMPFKQKKVVAAAA